MGNSFTQQYKKQRKSNSCEIFCQTLFQKLNLIALYVMKHLLYLYLADPTNSECIRKHAYSSDLKSDILPLQHEVN